MLEDLDQLEQNRVLYAFSFLWYNLNGDSMKVAVVLSGGGSKGSYQIGVWKALRKLHIKYDIVTGTSIGALNGALMVQKDYDVAYRLWTHLSYDKVLDDKIVDEESKVEVLKQYTKGVINGGLSVNALEKTIADRLNVKKFFRSKIDYALITVKFPSLKPIIKYKHDLKEEPDKLKDYLMASASCFPAFKQKQIGSENYIDGGYYDNLPINQAIDLGAEKIIAVDLNEVGIVKKPRKKVDIIYIKPHNYFGSFLLFEATLAKRGIRLGYNDAMKTFNKLDGTNYTFKKNHLKKNYRRYGKKYYQLLDDFVLVDDVKNKLHAKLFEFMLNKRLANKNKELAFNRMLENIGNYFKIDDSYIYSYRKFNYLIIKEFKKIGPNSYNQVDEQIKLNKLKLLFNSPEMVYYLYQTFDNLDRKNIYRLALLFPRETLAAIYLKTIIK